MNIRQHQDGKGAWHTRVSCDLCPDEKIEWPGGVAEAKQQLKLHNWSTGSTGIIRGPMCAQRQRAAMSAAIQRLRF